MLSISAVAVALTALLSMMLSLKVIGLRRKHQISVGDGGHEDLLRAIRTQTNLTEYAPITLLLLICLEANGAPWYLVIVPAISFLAGRLLHPVGMRADSSLSLRVLGMQLTIITIIALAIFNILWVVWKTFV